MSESPARRRRLRDRLGFQMAMILAIVLLPLTFVSLSKSLSLVTEMGARAESALLTETEQAAAAQVQLLQVARGAAELLAVAIVPMIDDPAGCSAMLQRLAARSPQYSLIAFIPRSGLMTCGSRSVPIDFSANRRFAEMVQSPAPQLVLNRSGQISGEAIVGVLQPVFTEEGDFIGHVSFSLPHRNLDAPDGVSEDSEDRLDLFTFQRDGNLLTSSFGLDSVGALPRDIALESLTGGGKRTFTALNSGGAEYRYAMVPLIPGELYALGARPAQTSLGLGSTLLSLPVLLPFFMWLASLIVAWLAVERLVLRNVRKISRSITTFAGGNRVVGDIEMHHAPIEVREMAEAYETMTESIIRDEAELEDTIHQKEVLLREVHHRVKNNLQLIASIMNMQVRRVKSSEMRQTLIDLRERVMSLATIHRDLFETSGRVDVHANELLSDIVRQLTGSGYGPDRQVELTTRFADIRLVPDQAVPLGLLTSEAITSAFKHGSEENGRGIRLSVSLTRDGSTAAILEVRNSRKSSPDGAEPATGLGSQLIDAFAIQIGGQVERTRSEEEHILRLTFPVRPLKDGEARSAASNVA